MQGYGRSFQQWRNAGADQSERARQGCIHYSAYLPTSK